MDKYGWRGLSAVDEWCKVNRSNFKMTCETSNIFRRCRGSRFGKKKARYELLR
jgi:hypothetical protein